MKPLERNLAIVTGVVSLFGFWLKLPCGSEGWGGSANNYYQLCYSDLGPLYYVRGFADGVIPYLQQYQAQYLEYPVLIGFWAWLVALLVQGWSNAGSAFVFVTWLTSLAMAVGAALTIFRINPRRVWWFALSPALIFALGINWDALAVLLAALALLAFKREQYLWAGIALGLGAAAKLYPALVLVPMVFALLNRETLTQLGRLVGGALGAWLAVNLPVFIASPYGWFEFYRFSRERGIDFGSPWLAARYLWNVSTETSTANLWGMIVMALFIVTLWFVRKRVDLFTAAFALIGIFALVNKVYSPQYWLWLTPLAALAAVRFREFAIWQISQLVYFVGIWRFLLFLVDPARDGGINESTYGMVIAIHWVTTAALVVLAVVRAYRQSSTTSGTVQP